VTKINTYVDSNNEMGLRLMLSLGLKELKDKQFNYDLIKQAEEEHDRLHNVCNAKNKNEESCSV
tara:strand:+ start:14182 stop:14373 length:192 start_codon:yes stop_codon:yes gene_type:complete